MGIYAAAALKAMFCSHIAAFYIILISRCEIPTCAYFIVSVSGIKPNNMRMCNNKYLFSFSSPWVSCAFSSDRSLGLVALESGADDYNFILKEGCAIASKCKFLGKNLFGFRSDGKWARAGNCGLLSGLIVVHN